MSLALLTPRPAIRADVALVACVFLLWMLQAGQALAAWPTDPTVNVPLCTAAGSQDDALAVSDGAGGAIVVWRDERAGFMAPGIYAQHVLATGVVDPAWPVNGQVLYPGPGATAQSAIISDGAGGAIIGYGYGGVRVQHLLASGQVDPGWPADGRIVYTTTGEWFPPTLAPDGAGGAIVSWYDARTGGGSAGLDIYAHHVLASGVLDPSWPTDGLPVVTDSLPQSAPKLAEDGSGGAFIIWRHFPLIGNSRLRAHHILASGTLDGSWPAGGSLLGGDYWDSFEGNLAADGPGAAIVVWKGEINVLFATRVVATGGVDPAWGSGVRTVCATYGWKQVPEIVGITGGGAIVAWAEERTAIPITFGVFAQRVLSDGTVGGSSWPTNGRALGSLDGDENARLVDDGDGGAIVAFEQHSPSLDIRAHHVLPAGSLDPAWGAEGVLLSSPAATQQTPQIVSNGTGGAVVAWTDARSGIDKDIYAQGVLGNGTLGGTPDPVLGSFTPLGGDPGTWVTLRGSGFTGATQVRFGSGLTSGMAWDSMEVVADSVVRAKVPANARTGVVTLGFPFWSVTSTDTFFIRPSVISFAPGFGTAGTLVTVTGRNFAPGLLAVSLNGAGAAFTVSSDSQLVMTVPAGATSGLIAATNPAGSGLSASSFFVGSAPQITGFTPAIGPAGTTVTITGTGFAGVTAVSFHTANASFTVDSLQRIIATVPAGAVTGPIGVRNPAGVDSSASNFFVGVAPSVASFTPSSGTAGASVTITGSNFWGATGVTFNGTSASFAVNSPTQVTATVPAGATTGPIAVTNPAGTGTSAASFFVGAAPSIASFTPTSGLAGASVTISGSNFTGITSVTFNGTSASHTVDSPTQITATVPAGATTGPIAVTNPAGTGTSVASFFVGAAPSVASFTPTSGPVGASVTLTGTSFTGATAVTFNGTSASYTVDSPTQITATAPAGATTGPIAVTNPAGTGASAASFFVGSAPVVSSFTPTSGLAGASVTITGSNFTGVSSVTFNGTSASHTVDSPTQITATVPAGATTGPIAVTNPAGTGTSAASFFVGAAPSVASFTPTSGLAGASVTITGSNFAGTTGVTFNGTPASHTVDSQTQITATVPAGATTGPVAVTNPAGTGTSAASFFVGEAPAVTAFAPAGGWPANAVQIAGTGFTGATAVTFNGTPASFTVNSSTLIVATVPAGATTGPIAVTNPAGTGTSAATFYLAVTLSAFTPAAGPVGTSVVLTGSQFYGVSGVAFNGTSASYTVDSPTQITATVPAGAASGPIGVTNPAGTVTSSTWFFVGNTPTISGFTPGGGAAGTLVTVTGTNFEWVSAVRFNGAPAFFTVSSPTELTATVPAGTTSGPVSVTNPVGTGASTANFSLPPTVSAFNPVAGPVGTAVTITGTNFLGTTAVAFNGTAATAFSVVSNTSITATVPSGATSGTVAVTNPAGSATSAASFTVTTGPVVTGFSPLVGAVGTTVFISGYEFTGATEVRFGPWTVASFTVLSPTQITATVPPGAATGTLRVTTPAGMAASAIPFLVTTPPGAPAVTGFAPTSGPSGTIVTVTGSGFTGVTQVWFGGRAATSFSVVSPAQLSAVVPSNAPLGPVSVAVTTPIGTGTAATSFEVTATVDASAQPHELRLLPPWPSPSRGAVQLGFTLPGPGAPELAIYDIAGARVAQLASGPRGAGTHLLVWNGRDDRGRPLAAGIYLVRLQAEGRTLTRRVVWLR